MVVAQSPAVSKLQKTWIASESSWRCGRRRRGAWWWRHSVGDVDGDVGDGSIVVVANLRSGDGDAGLGCKADVVTVVELGAELLVALVAEVVGGGSEKQGQANAASAAPV